MFGLRLEVVFESLHLVRWTGTPPVFYFLSYAGITRYVSSWTILSHYRCSLPNSCVSLAVCLDFWQSVFCLEFKGQCDSDWSKRNDQSSKHYGDSKVMDLQGRQQNSTIANPNLVTNKRFLFFCSSSYFISCTLESNCSRHFKLIQLGPSYN
jgi:hypothetical protein